MISHMLLIIQREIYATIQRRTVILFMFGVPIVLGLVAVVAYQFNKTPQAGGAQTNSAPVDNLEGKPLGYVDPSGLIASFPPFVPAFNYQRYDSQEQALQALQSEKIKGFFVIPADYAKGAPPEYFTKNNNPLSSSINNGELGAILTFNLLKSDPQLAQEVISPIKPKVSELPAPPAAQNATRSDNWYVSTLPLFMVILLYMVILVPSGNLVSGLTDEKKNRVMEVLLCSVSPMQLFVGKLLATGFLGLIQMLLWIGVLWGVGKFGGQPLQLPPGYSVPTGLLLWSVVFAMLGYMMYAAQLAGVGAMAPSANESRSVTILLMLPLIVGYSLSTVIGQAPYSPLAYILSYFPLTAPVAMIGRMAAVELPFWEPLLSAFCQLIGVIIIVRLFGRLFHASLMLSGQTLNVKRLFTALAGKA